MYLNSKYLENTKPSPLILCICHVSPLIAIYSRTLQHNLFNYPTKTYTNKETNEWFIGTGICSNPNAIM
jgi:hypothetical protein